MVQFCFRGLAALSAVWVLQFGFVFSSSAVCLQEGTATIQGTTSSSSSKQVPKQNVQDDQDPDSNSSASKISSESAGESSSVSKKVDPEKTFFGGATPTSIEELRSLEAKFAEISEMIKPATVNIQMGGSQGSGVVVTADGYILTAAHVIGLPNGKATVTFPDGKKFTATTLGVANRIDSGLLKLDEGQAVTEFPYVEMGLSSELKEGQWVMAIGHPGGIDEKRGLVVRAGRVIRSEDSVIQTDCTLVGGDSGGPLVNLHGEVIGIHSRIGVNLWDNLHVPVDVYSEKWDKMALGLVLDGRVGRLGFTIEDKTNVIESVTENGTAAKAGLQVGDRIIKIDDRTIESATDLEAVREELLPYMKLKVVVIRGEEEQTLELVVGLDR